MKKYLAYGILTLTSFFLILLLAIYGYPAIQKISGLAVAQSSTQWNSLKDASIGDNLTSGIGAFGLMMYDGTNFDRAKGDTTNGLDVDVTRVSGNVNVIGTKTPADAFVNPTDSIASYSFTGLFNGSTWDRARHSWNNISCNAVVTTGACTTIDISTSPKTTHTWTVVVTGAPTSVNVNLEGSIDNTNWFTLDSSTTTTSEMKHVINKGVIYYRGNVTALSGGTSPTVTVRIASF